ncbi:hypothetical protein Cni_G16795 [Canna indica]|uniref:U-box domain-containing protein n=1 Tax=Canna indica TaxID=4628 RepID=A0AAQ3KFS4_9LILI|nr:hypothetical protein Cni_G16795 [Canna indica]
MPGSVAPLDLAGVTIPYQFRCPISLELMRNPVTVCTVQTYDRSSIESWVATGNTTCPVTRVPLTDFTLIPNYTLRCLIQEWCVAHRALGVERTNRPWKPWRCCPSCCCRKPRVWRWRHDRSAYDD